VGSAALNRYLLDTHIWFWYVIGSDRLPAGLRKLIDAHRADCSVSAISVWELALLAASGRVELDTPPGRWIDEALVRVPFDDVPLNRAVALAAPGLNLAHRDPADRFIAATAVVFDLVLLTVDPRLLGLRWLRSRAK
jgi:PIN domain nuclease of toxin-antitoxin system